MASRPHHLPVTKERIPQHPDDVREWRETVTGFAMGLGVVLMIFGVIALSLVGTTEFMHSPTGQTPDIKDAMTTGRTAAVALLATGAGVVVIGAILLFKRRSPTASP